MVLGFALLIAVGFAYGKFNTPRPSIVNGTYYNECCGNIVLRDGEFSYKNASYNYDLVNMKFGLTAYLPGQLTGHGLEKSPDQSFLLFSDKDGKRSLDAEIDGKEYTFLKIK